MVLVCLHEKLRNVLYVLYRLSGESFAYMKLGQETLLFGFGIKHLYESSSRGTSVPRPAELILVLVEEGSLRGFPYR
jgi:hypothetical protein